MQSRPTGFTSVPNITPNSGRAAEVIDVDAYMAEVVDVDKIYMKYEVTDADGIESIGRDEYRRAKRQSKSKANYPGQDKSRSLAGTSTGAGPSTLRLTQAQAQQLEERRARLAQAEASQTNTSTNLLRTQVAHLPRTGASSNLNFNGNEKSSNPSLINRVSASQQPISSQSHNPTGRNDFPSTIGRAINEIKAINKRPSPGSGMNSQKRRKLDSSANRASSSGNPAGPSKLPPSSMTARQHPVPSYSPNTLTTPLAGSSKQSHTAPPPSSFRKQAPASPEISFVSYVASKRKRVFTPTSPAVAGNIRPERIPEVIELSSGSDNEEVAQMLSHKRKKLATSTSRSRSSSVEFMPSSKSVSLSAPISLPTPARTIATNVPYQPPPRLPLETDHSSDSESSDDGWDLNHPTRWKPMDVKNRLENGLVDEIDVEKLNISDEMPGERSPSPRRIRLNASRWNVSPQPKFVGPPEFIWDQLRLSDIRWKPRMMPMAMRFTSNHMRPFELDFYLHKLKIANSFKKTPGSISRIEQKKEWTVIAGASIGGLPDSPEDESDASVRYNRPGSLLTWNKNVFTPVGHSRENHFYALNNSRSCKYYAVHDVKFDPVGNFFASSGADKKVRFWALMDDPNDLDPVDESEGEPCPWKNVHSVNFKIPPHELAFKPRLPGSAGRSVLAIAGKKLFVKAYSEDGDTIIEHPISDLALMSRDSPHIVGSMSWGIGPTSNCLYVSTEPTDPTRFDGVHKVYDVESRNIMYQLEGKEAGDALAVDTTGTRLALSTRAEDNNHILRLFDITRKLPKATTSFHLEKFPALYDSFEGEVNCAIFSPDEMYLTLARNDNYVHMYDLRFLEKGPIFRYTHFGESKVESSTSRYGVTKAEWLHSKHTGKMALVTGGEDGCVRLWDPSKSDIEGKNGNCIAEVNSDIAYFSLGDIYQGEHQLIVGDCSGEVTIFDTLCI